MALRRVKQLYVDENGNLVADVEGGNRAFFAMTLNGMGQPKGAPSLNDHGKIPTQFIPSSVAGQSDVENIRIMLTRAALRLLATQNKDGGWEWMNPDTNPAHGVPSPYNTLGVTANGVLDCYRVGVTKRCLKAAEDTYAAMVLNSKDLMPAKHRIRGPDIGFLVTLSQIRATSIYADFAKQRWASAKAEFGCGTATQFARFIRDIRKGQNLPAIISWDINLYVQSLLALDSYFPNEGFDAEAKEMAEVIYESLYVPPVDFDITDHTLNEFWNGISGALDSFVTTDLHDLETDALADQLEGGQEDDGHFPGIIDGSDAQTTAYAVLALVHSDMDRPAVAAVNYLMTCQQANGGWLYNGGENTEVTSEAIQAIYHFTLIL